MIRFVLAMASFVGFVASIAWTLTFFASVPHWGREFWFDFGAFVLMSAFVLLNLLYLLFHGPSALGTPRVARLFGLWLDAKEAELRRRAGK
jgi:hypothetical protein